MDNDPGALAAIPVSNMRNGALAAINPAITKGTIPVGFHWVKISNMASVLAMEHIIPFIRSTWGQMDVNAGTAVLDRKKAIVIGAVRAYATAFYSLTMADIAHDERAAAQLQILNANPLGAPVVYGAAAGMANGPNDAKRDRAIAFAPLSILEKNVVAAVAIIGISVLPLNGISIHQTGHHYVTETYKIFAAVEKQMLNSADALVKDWWKASDVDLRDAAWHKACHPVNMSLKRTLALDPLMKERLLLAKCGSAAVRLPVVESAVHNGRSCVALLKNVVSIITANGGQCDFAVLAFTTELPPKYPYDGTAPAHMPNGAPAIVTTRPEALSYLLQMIERNEDTIAFAYGIYKAMLDRSGRHDDSLTKSYTISKIAQAHLGAVDRGSQWARAVAIKEATEASNGVVPIRDVIIA